MDSGIQTTLGSFGTEFPVWYPTENRIEEILLREREISLPELARKTGRSKSWVYKILRKRRDVEISKEKTVVNGICRQRIVVRKKA